MLDPIYNAIASALVVIHDHVLAPVFGAGTGAAWGLAIVLLVVGIRIVLFPLFLKQIRTQHAMQKLQPEMTRLREKYKNDRETLNREVMALYKEHGANPLSGCLPLIVQAPIFYALYRVLEHVGPSASAKYGLSLDQVHSLGRATIFGAPIASSFTDPLHADPTTVKVVTAVFLVVAGVVTFLSQRLILARRTATTADDTQAKMQRAMLYLAPLFILGFGFRFPLGVLVYWATSYAWTAGQTFYVVKQMPAPVAAGAAGRPGAAAPAKKAAPVKGGPAKTGPGKAAAGKGGPPPKSAQPAAPPERQPPQRQQPRRKPPKSQRRRGTG